MCSKITVNQNINLLRVSSLLCHDDSCRNHNKNTITMQRVKINGGKICRLWQLLKKKYSHSSKKITTHRSINKQNILVTYLPYHQTTDKQQKQTAFSMSVTPKMKEKKCNESEHRYFPRCSGCSLLYVSYKWSPLYDNVNLCWVINNIMLVHALQY